MLFSVIICAYNEAAWLGRCFKSLEMQAFDNYEIIIVNDNSFDDTEALIDAWRKNSSLNIRKINNARNLGLGASRNIAIAEAKGEYVFFLDGDDYLLDNRYFAEMANALEQEPDILVTPYARQKNEQLSYDPFTSQKYMCGIEAGQKYLSRAFGTHGACAKFFRRDCFNEHRFSEHGFSEDVKCLFPIFMNSKKVLCLRRYGYVYVFNPLSITRKTELGIADFYSSARLLTEILAAAMEYIKNGIEIDTSEYVETWRSSHAEILKKVAAADVVTHDLDIFRPFKAVFNEFCNSPEVEAFIERQRAINFAHPALPRNAAQYFLQKLAEIEKLPVIKSKIVIYAPSLNKGGLQKVAADLSRALTDLGHEIILLLEMPEEVSFPYKGRIYPGSFKSAGALYHLRTCEYFIDCVYEEDRKSYPVIKYVLDHFPRKYISTLHTTVNIDKYFKLAGKYIEEKKLLPDDFAAIFCVSENVRDTFLKTYPYKPAKLRILQNSVDLDRIRAMPPLKAAKPYILFCGRLGAVEHKGIDLLLRAYNESGLHTKFDLYMLGEGKLPATLSDYIKSHKLTSHVHFPGFSENVYSYMKSSAFVFHPSRWEGFGLVNVESLASGAPVLASTAGNASGAIKHKINGYLFNIDSYADMLAGLRYMAKHYKKMKSFCETGLEKYSYETYKENLAKALKSLK